MEEYSKTVTAIMDHAEGLVRTRGYNGFSFRDLATGVGIKSASVHYHFPTKGNLARTLARRYTDRFMSELESNVATNATASNALQTYIEIFRRSVIEDEQMCLCGMLGAEVAILPPDVVSEAKRFFELNLQWLISYCGSPKKKGSDARARALHIMATLEGAMIVSRTMGDPDVFDEITTELHVTVK